MDGEERGTGPGTRADHICIVPGNGEPPYQKEGVQCELVATDPPAEIELPGSMDDNVLATVHQATGRAPHAGPLCPWSTMSRNVQEQLGPVGQSFAMSRQNKIKPIRHCALPNATAHSQGTRLGFLD